MVQKRCMLKLPINTWFRAIEKKGWITAGLPAGTLCALVPIGKLICLQLFWLICIYEERKNMLVQLRFRVRLENLDLDHKIWIFGFPIDQKIWKRISSRITVSEKPFQEGVQFLVCSVTKSIFRFCIRLELSEDQDYMKVFKLDRSRKIFVVSYLQHLLPFINPSFRENASSRSFSVKKLNNAGWKLTFVNER